MNKWIIGGTLLAASLMANAETFSVHLATSVTTGAVMLPAGDYTLAVTKGNPGVLLLEGNTVKTFVFGSIVRSSPDAKPTVEIRNLKLADEPLKLAVNSK